MASARKYFQMHGVQLGPVLIYSIPQQKALGDQLSWAVSEGRSIEVRQKGNAILVLLSAADDLGHVSQIDTHGVVSDIGVTEKPL